MKKKKQARVTGDSLPSQRRKQKAVPAVRDVTPNAESQDGTISDSEFKLILQKINKKYAAALKRLASK